ncbi:hypothetical protein MESS2_730051 [Mesorhizobium metallidurans STM 2683]|uniref:Uncharacterized protein n=1 Tax=Mesorhizobium metallidurans STM 2683 TaxID=1297569 RepID=M5EVW6_9HYPH|nr:hypothetical protein MESS2_730051 [Mesorhizobium metallidurans STM 2683]
MGGLSRSLIAQDSGSSPTFVKARNADLPGSRGFPCPKALAEAAEEARQEPLLFGAGQISHSPFLAPARHVAVTGDEAGGILDRLPGRQRRTDRRQEQGLALLQPVYHRLALVVALPGPGYAVEADGRQRGQHGRAVAGIAAVAGELGGNHRHFLNADGRACRPSVSVATVAWQI